MLGTYFGYLLPLPTVLLEAINFTISLAVIKGLFALTFKLLPDVKVAWRDVWLGAAVTSLLFSVGKLLIGLYLGKSGVASVFGAAGSLVVILVWVYYSAQVLCFGAEFTKVWTRWRGGGFVADEKAVPVTAAARAEQGIGQKLSSLVSTILTSTGSVKRWRNEVRMVLPGFLRVPSRAPPTGFQ